MNKIKYDRRSIRLKNYNYSQKGVYFITICSYKNITLFGNIVDNEMILNSAGRMIKDQWLSIANENIKIHNYCIMPNHFHAIIEFTRDIEHKNIKNNGAPTRDAPTLGNVIGSFKSLTTNNYIEMVKRNILPPFEKRIWQKNYYELIIKSYKAYIKISEYIKNNPLKWKEDRYYL